MKQPEPAHCYRFQATPADKARIGWLLAHTEHPTISAVIRAGLRVLHDEALAKNMPLQREAVSRHDANEPV